MYILGGNTTRLLLCRWPVLADELWKPTCSFFGLVWQKNSFWIILETDIFCFPWIQVSFWSRERELSGSTCFVQVHRPPVRSFISALMVEPPVPVIEGTRRVPKGLWPRSQTAWVLILALLLMSRGDLWYQRCFPGVLVVSSGKGGHSWQYVFRFLSKKIPWGLLHWGNKSLASPRLIITVR